MKKKLLLVAGLTLLSSMAMGTSGQAVVEAEGTVDYKFEIIKPLIVETSNIVNFGLLNPGQSYDLPANGAQRGNIKVTGDKRRSLLVTYDEEVSPVGEEFKFFPKLQHQGPGQNIASGEVITNWGYHNEGADKDIIKLQVIGKIETTEAIESGEYTGEYVTVNFKYQ